MPEAAVEYPLISAPLAYAGLDPMRLTTDGRIVDFLDPKKSRPNKPEERVRQNFGRKLHFEYGYPKNLMAFEVPINIGVEAKQADIVIFRNVTACAQRDQAGIALVIETKAPDRKTGEKQLQSYVFASSADGGVWYNERDAPVYWRRVEVPARGLKEWPNIPRFGQEWDGVGMHTKASLRPPHDLVETFRGCHNALYKVGIDSEDIAMDMVRIILAKYRDEMNEGDTCEFRCTPIELQSPEGRRRVAQRVRDLFVQVRNADPGVFDRDEKITAGDKEIATVVSELQDFRFVPEDDTEELYDVVGAAYEVYVGSHLKGDRGQYFTPRLVVQLLVRLVNPTERDLVVDPAMGSGGFLITTMRHVSRAIAQSDRTKAAKRKAFQAFCKRLYGIDKSPKLVKVARTNMILASDGHAGLVKGDSLEPLDILPDAFRPKEEVDRPTVILTNPPFGATAEHKLTAETEKEILSAFQLGHVWRKDPVDGALKPGDKLTGEGVPPEYLFVERCIRWLKPGGMLGIVIPRGILVNDKALPVRTLMFPNARILAVVNCHDDTFKPHTDAKAAVVVLEKKESPSDHDDDYPIFMAISQGIGHTGLGEPIYRTDEKGDTVIEKGHPVLDQDLDDIYRAWVALRAGQKSPSDYYYMTSRKKLTADLNMNPVRYLPKYSRSRQEALRLGERDGWTAERLGHIAAVYNGPRFKRPYADKDVTSGPTILRYFTGNAITQTRGENIKYLDLRKAKPLQLKMIDKLYLTRGMIVVTDSGTIGRVIYTTAYHEGAIGTNNLIRVVVEDEALRGYVYQFLLSPLGQDQLKTSNYGSIVDHIEPPHVKEVIVPVPQDPNLLKSIGLPVIRAVEMQEEAYQRFEDSLQAMQSAFEAGPEPLVLS